jgi:uncharacterized protein YjeT (DUF2065 family)
MLITILGIFFILHGLVHLLYAGQSKRLFELRPHMTWPDGAWAFARLFGDQVNQTLAGILLALAALGFVSSGLGLFIRQEWWRPVAVGSAVLSTAVFLLFWDGKLQALADKGGVGILINLAILAVVLALKWPS